MSNILSLINVKGGVGKTQSCINIGGELNRRGYKVLLIDNDPQSSLTQILGVKGEYTMYDLYSNPRVTYDDCIVHLRDNIYVIPNNIESAILERELQNRITREIILRNKLQKWYNDFDYIIIDNSPFLGICVQNSLTISDYYIEIVDNSPSALQGLNMVKKLLHDMQEGGIAEELKLLGILRNNFDKRSNFSKDFNEVIEEQFKEEAFNTIIYNSVKYKEAVAYNKTIQEYSQDHAEPYIRLVDEIVKRVK